MLKVGLTGSIAVGKSVVCSILRDNGIHILDADITAREVVEPNTEGLAEIVRAFGKGVLTVDGRLDRKKMADIVFEDGQKRAELNAIVHPLVFTEQDNWIRECERSDPHGVAVVDAALMIESGGYKRFDKLIVVWCEPAIQLQRLRLRDHLSEEEAKKRIAAQMSQEDKRRFADHQIDTSNGLEDTQRQTRELAGRLRALASNIDAEQSS